MPLNQFSFFNKYTGSRTLAIHASLLNDGLVAVAYIKEAESSKWLK